jgi:glyoxylase-like metal-dependent hydrolase (beta-lactamase superfamily II)
MGTTRTTHMVGRRWLLTRTSGGVVGFALLGLAACDDSGDSAGTPAADSGSPADAGSDPSETADDEQAGQDQQGGGLEWARVDLGFVSAYVLVRGREAAVVDTGVGGSADAIGAVLDEAGPGWSGVRHVVLTHKHPDHAGSASDVLTEAPDAAGYVGEADLSEVDAPRQLTGLRDGDEVFGLQIVGTPGHTAGHMAVFDPDTGVLVAGDALNNDGGLAGSSPQFTEDEQAAAESVRKLAALGPAAILVGHGAPVLDGASDALRQLADSLG